MTVRRSGFWKRSAKVCGTPTCAWVERDPRVRGWHKVVLLVSAGVLFVLLFSGEIRDNDIFWHLKTGQYILETHSLPVPDPFSYVSVGSSYPGEEITRRFNLTHEWLSQVILYLTWRTLGFPGLVIGRVLLLT